jgi:hypothetical protein
LDASLDPHLPATKFVGKDLEIPEKVGVGPPPDENRVVIWTVKMLHC